MPKLILSRIVQWLGFLLGWALLAGLIKYFTKQTIEELVFSAIAGVLQKWAGGMTAAQIADWASRVAESAAAIVPYLLALLVVSAVAFLFYRRGAASVKALGAGFASPTQSMTHDPEKGTVTKQIFRILQDQCLPEYDYCCDRVAGPWRDIILRKGRDRYVVVFQDFLRTRNKGIASLNSYLDSQRIHHDLAERFSGGEVVHSAAITAGSDFIEKVQRLPAQPEEPTLSLVEPDAQIFQRTVGAYGQWIRDRINDAITIRRELGSTTSQAEEPGIKVSDLAIHDTDKREQYIRVQIENVSKVQIDGLTAYMEDPHIDDPSRQFDAMTFPLQIFTQARLEERAAGGDRFARPFTLQPEQKKWLEIMQIGYLGAPLMYFVEAASRRKIVAMDATFPCVVHGPFPAAIRFSVEYSELSRARHYQVTLRDGRGNVIKQETYPDDE